MKLAVGATELEFLSVELYFSSVSEDNIFTLKNNKTVAETLTSKRYAHLRPEVEAIYTYTLHQPLGVFLSQLKESGDLFYKRFLNGYGDEEYCVFSIKDAEILKQKGLYIFTVNTDLKYVGKSTNSFGKRINQGYGKIHPKNCYRDGQATNCHLNSLIAKNRDNVSFYVHPMIDNNQIGVVEKGLIQQYQPKWNILLKKVY